MKLFEKVFLVTKWLLPLAVRSGPNENWNKKRVTALLVWKLGSLLCVLLLRWPLWAIWSAEIHCTNLITQDSSFLNSVWPSDQGLACFRFTNVNVTSKVNFIPTVHIVLKFLLRLSTVFLSYSSYLPSLRLSSNLILFSNFSSFFLQLLPFLLLQFFICIFLFVTASL